MTKYRGKYSSTWFFCSKCNSAHIDPYPTEEELLAYYNSNYTEMDFSETNDSSVNHKLRFSDEYEKNVFKEYQLSLSDCGIDVNGMRKMYGRVLDFGCANGVFLRYLKKNKFDANQLFGCDVGEKMLAEAHNVTNNIFCTSDLDKIQYNFDLITMWDVIEHIYEPKPLLKKLINRLTDKGEFLVQTPNFGLLAELMGKNYSHYLVIEHINLFSREALVDLFDSLGMELCSASSFGANIKGIKNEEAVKSTFDRISKMLDFGATQIVRFKKR